eukprot:scaffold80075_cov27-Phaeocystis_antarctica.AAC.1
MEGLALALTLTPGKDIVSHLGAALGGLISSELELKRAPCEIAPLADEIAPMGFSVELAVDAAADAAAFADAADAATVTDAAAAAAAAEAFAAERSAAAAALAAAVAAGRASPPRVPKS